MLSGHQASERLAKPVLRETPAYSNMDGSSTPPQTLGRRSFLQCALAPVALVSACGSDTSTLRGASTPAQSISVGRVVSHFARLIAYMSSDDSGRG